MQCIASLLFLALVSPSPHGGPTHAAAHASATQASHDLPAALAHFQSVLAQDPTNAAAQDGLVATSEQLALQQRSAGDDGAALRTLLQAQQAVPGSPRLLYDTAVLEDGMKLYWDADRTLTRLEAVPMGSAPQVLYLAARVKMDLGQLAKAEQAMHGYLAAKPDDATAHYGLGRILQMEEHFEAATAEFERSIQLQPQQTESQFQLGEIALAQGHYQEAIAEYAMALTGNPKHGGALAGTGIAYFHLKQYADASTWLHRAIAAAPDYQPAHYYLGLTLARMGQQESAKSELAVATAMAQAQNQQASQRLHIEQQPPATTTPTEAKPQ